MSDGLPSTRPPASGPEIGLWVPTAALHVAFFAIAAGLCLLVLATPLWLAIGLLLAAATSLVPNLVPALWLLLVLSLSQFWREPLAKDFVYYLLLAGVHLLHVLGGITRLLPWNGRLQVAGLVRPLRRFGFVQLVAQPVAFGVLLVFGGGLGLVRGLSILAAVVLGVVALVLFRGLRRARVPG